MAETTLRCFPYYFIREAVAAAEAFPYIFHLSLNLSCFSHSFNIRKQIRDFVGVFFENYLKNRKLKLTVKFLTLSLWFY